MTPRTCALWLLSLATVAGCSGGAILDLPDLSGGRTDSAVGPGGDLAVPPGGDLAMADMAREYTPATVHQIDTDPGNGPFGNSKLLSLDHLVAVTDVDKYVNATNQQCRYQIWVQDPACQTPPCGMVVKVIGPMAPSPNSTGKDCPGARISGTLLANINRGDNIKVAGKVLVEIDSVSPMTVVEHQIFADVVTPILNDKVIMPTVLTDATMYGEFVTHTGTFWNKYEGMYITLMPSKGLLQVSGSSGGFQTDPGHTNWGDTFDSDYTAPNVGNTFKSISGVVSCRHGGEINPTRNKDFVVM